MRMTVTDLRRRLFRVLDEVIETGVPVEIERHGGIVRIVSEPQRRRKKKSLELISRPDAIVGDPDDLIHMDWSSEWRP